MRDEPEGFEQLWLLWRDYARKSDGRGKARPTYRNWLREGANPDDILCGARWHVRSMKPEERPYIQLLSVYLNSERWADECEKERQYQASLADRANVVHIKPVSNYKPKFLREFERKQQEG
jgi:hypothetical protein